MEFDGGVVGCPLESHAVREKEAIDVTQSSIDGSHDRVVHLSLDLHLLGASLYVKATIRIYLS